MGLWLGCEVMLCDSNDHIGVGVRITFVVEMCDSNHRDGDKLRYGSGGAELGWSSLSCPVGWIVGLRKGLS